MNQVSARLLHAAWLGIAYKLFGWNLNWHFLILPTVYALAALIFLAVLNKLLPGQYALALGASLLFLVYPADPTRTILGMIGHAHSLLFFLLAAWLMLRLAEARSPAPLLWAAMPLCVLIGLLSFEQVIPLAAAAPLLLIWFPAFPLDRHRLRIALAWYGGLASFIGWRVYVALFTDYGLHHFGAGRPSLAAADLLTSFATWFSNGAIMAWPWVVRRMRWALALRSPDRRQIPLYVAAGVLLGVLVIGWLLVYLRSSRASESGRGGEAAENSPSIRKPARLLAVAVLIGLMAAALGYVVVPFVYDPPPDNLGFISRYQSPASLGLGFAWAALLFLLGHLGHAALKRLWPRMPFTPTVLAWGLVAGFASFAILWHVTIVQMWEQDWAEKASLWRAVLAAAPVVEPDSLLVLIDPPNPNHLRGAGFITPMVQMLYEDPTLAGDFAGEGQFITPVTAFYADRAVFSLRSPVRYGYDQVVLIQLGGTPADVTAELIGCLPPHLLDEAGAAPPCTDLSRVQRVERPLHPWLR